MSKKNNEVANMLMDAFKVDKIKEEAPKEKLELDYKLLDEVDSLKLFYSETPEGKLKDFLKERSVKLFNIKAAGVIGIGEILSEVFSELSRSEGFAGIYTKWLEANEISPRTALRYRTRYELYKLTNDEHKKTVVLLPQTYIDEISKEENTKTCIELINAGATSKEIIEMLKKEKVETVEEIKVIEKEINLPEFLTKSFVKKIENLDKKKHKQALKYIAKLNELLGDE